MAKHHPWKDLERRHAKRMGGERIWRQDFSEVAPDGETDDETWDCKCYARFSVIEKFVNAERKYRLYNAGRRFHLCLFSRAHRGAGDFVLIKADDYRELLRKAGELQGCSGE
jgi:hypothetical protein